MTRYDRNGELGSAVNCSGCGGGPCKQSWQFHGNYANDPHGLRWAISRAHWPVTTPEERARVHAYNAAPERERERAQLVPTRRGYGVTIANEAEWFARTYPNSQTGESHATLTAGLSAHSGPRRQNRRR